MQKTILLFSILYFQLTLTAQTYSLTVTNGYGSGNYTAGDTVNIWSAAIPVTASFDKWTGDTGPLESTDEWHTTLVMPAQNVALSANFKTIGTININYEKIMGRDTIKNVYSYFPAGFKGVIFCFHGTGGAASNWVNALEYRQFLNDAIADTFGFIITEAEEITKQTDFDQNGKLRWAPYPADTATNVDYANIKVLMDTFRLRGITNSTTEYFAVGMSNGGSFSPAIATAFQWKAAVSYCAQSNQLLMNTTNVPTQWCMAKYDNNDNVGAAGNAGALLNHNTLVGRGICSNYFLHDHSPVYAERFMRSGTITITLNQANNLLNEFRTNQLLDSSNYLLFASDTIGARILASPASYPVFNGLNVLQKLFVSTQVDVMYAAHQFYSDYNKRTLRFFKSLCDTLVVATAVSEIKAKNTSFKIYPNPSSGNLLVTTNADLTGKELQVFDSFGRMISETRVTGHETALNASGWFNGIYFIKIGGSLNKFVKQE